VQSPHQRRIGRGFALANRPVTVAQWQRFLGDRPGSNPGYPKRYRPGPEEPVSGVSWYEAARYCNWLSAREGIPEAEWCYPREITEGRSRAPTGVFGKSAGPEAWEGLKAGAANALDDLQGALDRARSRLRER
jgi:hypothetical protein